MNNNFVIENGVLIQCKGMEITKIPEGVHTIRANSISDAFSIKELYLPSTLEKVETKAFEGCNGLRKLVMPTRFTSLWDDDNMRYRLENDHINTSAVFFSFFGRYISSDLEEIVVFGEEKDLDLQWFDFKAIQMRQNIVLRIENEVTSIKFGDNIKNISHQYITPKICVNNYVENVQIDIPEKWDQKNITFRAPKPNIVETIDNSVEFTLAPRANWYNDTRWSCPIMINVSAVTYLYPVELSCFESETHLGCKLLLLGNRIEDIPLEQLSRDTYPSIIVWEDYDTVYNKLKAKGWTR